MMTAATGNLRFTFTAQFLRSSVMFARRCAEIESINPDDPDDPMRTEHLGLATAAVMQCTAAVEAQNAELALHGPGAHLGSGRFDPKARDLLRAQAARIDAERGPLEKYNVILGLLGKPLLSKEHKTWQQMALLVKVRNQITHYKSFWGNEMETEKLFKALRQLRLKRPPFIPLSMNFFPHQFWARRAPHGLSIQR